jgi:quinoprotein glucose dehydrogenase
MNPYLLVLLLLLSGNVTLRAQSAAEGNRDWPVYNGGADGTHYSPLAQINRKNVSQLQVAWTYDAADAFPGSEMECNPLIVNGVLYATTAKLNVIALDAATGKLLWRFDPNRNDTVIVKMRSRGVTYWSDGGKDQRVFFAAQQYLYPLDAATGNPIKTFGDGGRIDLRDNLGREPKMWATMTSPGTIYKDLLIVGSSLAETLPTPPGDIRAYNVRTGELRWSFHTIPHPGEFGYDTWPKEAWKYTGGVNDWTGFTLDEQRGLVFASTGSAATDFYGANRTGNDLFANSVIALNAATGERVWHYQTVQHDIWDRDLPAAPVLVTVNRDGRPVDALAQTTKSGYVFLFDRTTGAPVFPVEKRKYPSSDIEGETTSPTQGLPLVPPPFARQKLTEEILTDRTPQAHQEVLERFRKIRSGGQFVPGSREGTIIFPGYDGGAEWGGPAFDPQSHRLYVNANEMAWILRLVEQKPATEQTSGQGLYMRTCSACHGKNMQGSPPEFPSLVGLSTRRSDSAVRSLVSQGSGRMPSFSSLGDDQLDAIVDYVYKGIDTSVKGGAPSPYDMKFTSDGYHKFLDSEGYPAIRPPWGTFNAINLDTGKIDWTLPLGEYPELAAKGLKQTGSENYGGPVLTAGGLLFIGATNYDKKFRAFDKDTGELLWETTLPAAGNATPATYQVNGRQFVVIAAGGGKWGAPSGASYVAFALPQ